MGWRPVVLLVAALMVVACGGGEEAADTADAAELADAAPTEPQDASGGDGVADGAPDDEAQEVLDELDFGDGGARIVLGGRTYEFTLGGNSPEVDGKVYLGTCRTLFGAIAAHGYDIQDGAAVTMEFELPPVDWESYEDGRFDTTTPRIKIENVATEETWVADLSLADLYPETAGASQIDDWVTDGTTASGTATFTALTPWSAPVEGEEPLQGTFELGCADD